MDELCCPMGVRLAGRKVVFAGAGEVAQRKIHRVLNLKAKVVVVAPDIASDIQRLASLGEIAVHEREVVHDDFDGAFLAFIATSDAAVNQALAAAARERGALINQADDPENCDFVLPALAYMNNLRIGIFSDSPSLSKWVRRYLERTLGDKFPEFAGVFGAIRKKIRSMDLPQPARAEIMNRLLNEGLYDLYRESGEKAIRTRADEVVREYKPPQS